MKKLNNNKVIKFRKKNIKKKINAKNKGRIFGLGACIVFGMFLLSLRLAWITVFKGDEYSKLATEQWTKEVEVKAKRGRILDRNSIDLAVSGDVYRVDLDLKTLRETLGNIITKEIKNREGKIDKDQITLEQKGKLASSLAEILEKNKEDIIKLIDNRDINAAELARQIDKEKADKIKELKIRGIIVADDTKRYYPNGSLLAHGLGTIDSNGKGLIGLELQYDSILSGVSGVKIGENSPFGNESYTSPVQGKDLILTIDQKIQHIAEKEAKKALEEENSESVNILVMDPTNGEILAMASEKSFDPNNPRENFESFSGQNDGEKIQQMWRNKIVSDIYEPGSTFKVIMAAAGIEEGIAGKGESYYCSGFKKIDGRIIHCWKREGHGAQSFEEILNNSCNPGFMDIGMKLGKEKVQKYVEAFGFGNLTGIDLPGESKGIIKKLEDMSLVDLATISFGQTNAVTMVQLLTAFNATVNGGYLITPHINKEITHLDKSGVRVIDEKYEAEKTNVISEETSKKIREMLQLVVDKGTGKKAFIEGYNVGGKTGTAQTVDSSTGTYGKNKIASFIAEAPSDNPKVTVLVTVDAPKATAESGGTVAAPVAKRILESIFNYNSPESLTFETNLSKSVIVPEVRGKEISIVEGILKENKLNFEKTSEGNFVKSINPIPGSIIGEGETVKIELSNKASHEKEIIVPDFLGYSKEMAEKLAKNIGLNVSFKGEGDLIQSQTEKSGTKVKSGTKIVFNLKK